MALVAGNGRVNSAGPGVDASGQGLGVGKSLVAQPEGDIKGARSVVAKDYDRSIGIEFGVGAGGNLAHGHEERVGDVCGLVLPGFADVQQEGRGGLLALAGKGFGRDFEF
jgi:hypothetical protein